MVYVAEAEKPYEPPGDRGRFSLMYPMEALTTLCTWMQITTSFKTAVPCFAILNTALLTTEADVPFSQTFIPPDVAEAYFSQYLTLGVEDASLAEHEFLERVKYCHWSSKYVDNSALVASLPVPPSRTLSVHSSLSQCFTSPEPSAMPPASTDSYEDTIPPSSDSYRFLRILARGGRAPGPRLDVMSRNDYGVDRVCLLRHAALSHSHSLLRYRSLCVCDV
jgi:hypothetical protein